MPDIAANQEALPDSPGEAEDAGLILGSLNSQATANDRQDMLSDELHHRVQNTLAIVLALARITARSSSTIEDFQEAFGARIQAMARTNALLLRGHAQAIDVREAVELELEPYAGRQIAMHCDPLTISADSALSLSLLIHELATNAAKYGGLSTSGGELLVRCERRAAGGVLTWREWSPGMVTHDRVSGAGSVLIRRLAKDLGGSAILDFAPSGLEATVTFVLSENA
jgi:two-component sensor histidine kinase